MTIQTLERVMWRLRKKHKDAPQIGNNDLRRAIMLECGTDTRTYKSNRKALFMLKWIETNGPNHIKLTDNDITGDDT